MHYWGKKKCFFVLIAMMDLVPFYRLILYCNCAQTVASDLEIIFIQAAGGFSAKL
jgi:hypothetical protein